MKSSEASHLSLVKPLTPKEQREGIERDKFDEIAERIDWITENAGINPKKAWEMLLYSGEIMLAVARIVRNRHGL